MPAIPDHSDSWARDFVWGIIESREPRGGGGGGGGRGGGSSGGSSGGGKSGGSSGGSSSGSSSGSRGGGGVVSSGSGDGKHKKSKGIIAAYVLGPIVFIALCVVAYIIFIRPWLNRRKARKASDRKLAAVEDGGFVTKPRKALFGFGKRKESVDDGYITKPIAPAQLHQTPVRT